MSDTHYYYALNRRAAERVFDLTWNQFLKKYGWGLPSQWEDIAEFFAFALDQPLLPEKPDPQRIAPILRRTIRETIRRMSPQYFCILELSYQLRRRSFVKVDLEAEDLEDESDALSICAVRAFLEGDIDQRTLQCVLTLHREWASDLLSRWHLSISDADRRRIKAALPRRRCHPIFTWQSLRAVQDGHTALGEDDTRRFARFIQLAWRNNWPIHSEGKRLLRVRNLELAGNLHSVCRSLPGNCLIHYYGP